MKEEKIGTTEIMKENYLTKLNEESKDILTDSLIMPFHDIDQVQSRSMILIDESTNQLKELMESLTKTVITEENLFKGINSANAACNCAKQISSLLRIKLDIYREYKKTIKMSSPLEEYKPNNNTNNSRNS